MAGPGGPPIFFEKNKLDLDFGTSVTVSVTDATATEDGAEFLDFLRNRSNATGWATTDSNDAANTELEFILTEEPDANSLMLLQHNFADYTIQRWNGSSYEDFSPAISVSGNTSPDTLHEFTLVDVPRIKIIVTGTIVADDDKFMSQVILTEKIGQFTRYPMVSDVELSKKRRTVSTLSGKSKVFRSVGNTSFKINYELSDTDADQDLIETLADNTQGFLVWLNGDDEVADSQFRAERAGYRRSDVYLMQLKNEYSPDWKEGNYKAGIKVRLDLVEII